jgi:hypothetical protein
MVSDSLKFPSISPNPAKIYTYTLDVNDMMQRAGWIDVFYIVGSRKQVKGTFCTIGRREHIDILIQKTLYYKPQFLKCLQGFHLQVLVP